MSRVYTYPDGSSERRYTLNEARAIFALRLFVFGLCSPFLLLLRAVVPEDVFDDLLKWPPSIRMIEGDFYQ